LKAEVSFPIGSVNGVPIRSLRSLSNRAHVRDNQTLVIGGILREDERSMDSKVPGLGNLPLLGRLFKKEEKTDFRSELMVFVTPTIYRRPEDITWDRMIDISENLRDRALIPEAAIRGEMRKN
jgi:type II secretory pathway component GspD/PulD (secretin)